MAVEQLNPQPAASSAPASAGTRFPGYDLTTCTEVARSLYMKAGGQATPDALASYLGYKGTNNGAYLTKVAAARYFGLIHKVGSVFMPTPLAHQILSPVYPLDAKKALVEAFLNVELFRKIYDDFKGRELPPEVGMLNAMRNQYGVATARAKDAYRSLMESADTAGFFETRNGARTHLIVPSLQGTPQGQKLPSDPEAAELGGGSSGGSGGGGDGGEPEVSRANNNVASTKQLYSVADVKAKYLSALIELFETKSKQGDLDEKLMERIERLLGENPSGGAPRGDDAVPVMCLP